MHHDATVPNFGLGFAWGEGREESLKDDLDEPFRGAEHSHDTTRCAADAKRRLLFRKMFAWQELRACLHLSAEHAAVELSTTTARLFTAFKAHMKGAPAKGIPGWPDKELARAAKKGGEDGVRELVGQLDIWASGANDKLKGFANQSPSHSTLSLVVGATPTETTLKSFKNDLHSTMYRLGQRVFAFDGSQEQRAIITSEFTGVSGYCDQLKRGLDAILKTYVLLNFNAATGQDMQTSFTRALIISGSTTLNIEECLLVIVEMEKCQEFVQKLPLALVGIIVADLDWPVSQWSVSADAQLEGTRTSFGISAGNPGDILLQAKQMVLATAMACCPLNTFTEFAEVISTYGEGFGMPENMVNVDGWINGSLSPGDSAPMMVIHNAGPSHHHTRHWPSLVSSASWASLIAKLTRAVKPKQHGGQKFEQEREHHDLLANIQSTMEQMLIAPRPPSDTAESEFMELV